MVNSQNPFDGLKMVQWGRYFLVRPGRRDYKNLIIFNSDPPQPAILHSLLYQHRNKGVVLRNIVCGVNAYGIEVTSHVIMALQV